MNTTVGTISVWSHPACLEHLPPLGHPDHPGRLRVLLEELSREPGPWDMRSEAPLQPEEDTLGVVRWIHDSDYIRRFRHACENAPTVLGSPDNPVSPGSFRSALAAAGLATTAALEAANNRLRSAFLAVRPPGHNAAADRARGFCFFNNVALAAEILSRAWHAPLLIVDFDAHHGGGTQRLFYERADIGFVSVHRHPFFPGTGAADETGAGPGLGTTRNVPLAAAADDDIYASAFETALDEIAARLRPALILVSAGFTAHVDDPVGGMRVTESGFARMGRGIAEAAARYADGRVLTVLEGGYHPRALARSVCAYLRGLAGTSQTIN